jgi:hypothetical protein
MLEGRSLSETSFAKYEPFQLNEIQTFVDDPSTAPADSSAQIANKFDIQRAQEPKASRWCVRVAAILRKIQDLATLERVAGQIDIQVNLSALTSVDVTVERVRNCIVTLLHHRDPLDAVPAVTEILVPLDDPSRLQLHKFLLAKWVPNESVEILLGTARHASQIGLLTIEDMGMKAIEQYLNRALIEIEGGTVWAVSVSAATPDKDDAIYGQVEDTIRENMANEPFYDQNGNLLPLPQVIDREVMTSPLDVAICVLPSSCSREPVLHRLRADYPRIVFVA